MQSTGTRTPIAILKALDLSGDDFSEELDWELFEVTMCRITHNPLLYGLREHDERVGAHASKQCVTINSLRAIVDQASQGIQHGRIYHALTKRIEQAIGMWMYRFKQ